MVENQFFEGSQLDQLAKLPTRKETLAAILGSIQAPVTGIVGALHAVVRDLVSIIHAIETKKAA